jgi:hypothetical protein
VDTFITSLFEAGNAIMFASARGGRVSFRTTRGSAKKTGGKEKKAAKSLALSSREAREKLRII